MITHAWLLAAATILKRQKQASSRQCDRVVKAMDQNSAGLCAKELESPHCRRARPGATARHSSAAGCSPARAGSQRSSHTATARQRGPAWTRLTPIARADGRGAATSSATARRPKRRQGPVWRQRPGVCRFVVAQCLAPTQGRQRQKKTSVEYCD